MRARFAWSELPDAQAAALCAARHVGAVGRRSVAARGVFVLGLSGGSTPERFFQALAALPPAESPPWKDTHFFWVDERLVPPEDERSNYGLARRLLLAELPLASGQVHRVLGELGLQEATAAYEAELERFLGPLSGGAGRFDLVHLGLGPDGHTASLFPGSPVLEERSRRVVGVAAPGCAPFVARVTLTLPVLSGSRQALFLAAGQDKLELARAVLAQSRQADPVLPTAPAAPAARVRPSGQTLWVVSP